MASGQVVARTPVEALQRSLEAEKLVHRQCQLRMRALTMELHLSQKKADDLAERLSEESRSHAYFKSRLATIKIENRVPRADLDAMAAEVASLSAEKLKMYTNPLKHARPQICRCSEA